MLARLQQATTLFLLAFAAVWLACFIGYSPLWAWLGAAVIVAGYSVFLALEFVMLRLVGRNDPAPQPAWRELFRAWVGETLIAPRVFYWRQPFRSNQVPDHLEASALTPGLCGVVLVHGFVCNRGFWTPWLQRLKAGGHGFVAVNLEPVFGGIDDYIPIIEQAVQRVTAATGRPPVIVAHSMGGLAVRAWLRAMDSGDRVAHVITLGTPHRGTWLGRFSRVLNGRQMHLGSEWLGELTRYANETRHVNFTCWYSNCDNIVFPASTATLPGAHNRLVRAVAHVQLAFNAEVMRVSLAKIASL